jgi:hypothetical protein
MDLALNKAEYNSVKKSFFNIFALFLNLESINNQMLDCIFKWGVQLGISRDELHFILNKPDAIQYEAPENQMEAIEHVYDIVYMIYLDGIVEDVELEVTMKYAEKLGFKPHIVGDLLKAIVTAPHDGLEKTQVRKELGALLESSLTI